MNYNKVLYALQNLTKRNISQTEIANVLGYSPQLMNKRAKRNSSFSDDEIKQLELTFNVDLSKKTTTGNQVTVTYRPDVYLSAGYGIEIYEETEEKLTLDARLFITDRGNRINPADCEVVAISGNSMAPEYRHGDKVIIDRSDTELMDGHIFAFRYKGQCFVKEINLLSNKIKCISLNKEYDPFYINEDEDFMVLGRILPRIRL